jgi:hypothetical protein
MSAVESRPSRTSSTYAAADARRLLDFASPAETTDDAPMDTKGGKRRRRKRRTTRKCKRKTKRRKTKRRKRR